VPEGSQSRTSTADQAGNCAAYGTQPPEEGSSHCSQPTPTLHNQDELHNMAAAMHGRRPPSSRDAGTQLQATEGFN